MINKKILLLCIVFVFLLINVFTIQAKFEFWKNPLFTSESVATDLNIDTIYSRLSPGDEIIAELKMYNLNNDGRKDVLVKSYLIDKFGKKSLIEEQTVAIEAQSSILLSGSIPELEDGIYTFTSEIYPQNKDYLLGKSSQRIVIASKEQLNNSNIDSIIKQFGAILIGIGIIILSIAILLKIRQNSRNNSIQKNIK